MVFSGINTSLSLKMVRNESNMSHPHCDDCDHQMVKKYEFDIIINRIANEKKEYNYEQR